MASTDFAFVIGIDRYTDPRYNLNNAVRGAADFYEWLVDKAGVPAGNVVLLLSPLDDAEDASIVKLKGREAKGREKARWKPATFENINKTLPDELGRRSHWQGSRFFFYYAGHGFSLKNAIGTEDAIIPSDYVAGHNPQPYSFESVRTFFQGTSFRNQFFILDSCRDLKHELFRLQSVPELPGAEDQSPDVLQVSVYATSLFKKSNDFNGGFTDLMLEGLYGRVPCYEYDCHSGSYKVSLRSLYRFLVAEFAKHKEWNQTPKIFGDLGGADVVLSKLIPGVDLKTARVNLTVAPASTRIRKVTILDACGEKVAEINDVMKLPPLFPREYTLIVDADGYPLRKERLVVASDPTEFPLNIGPADHEAAVPEPGPAAAAAAEVRLREAVKHLDVAAALSRRAARGVGAGEDLGQVQVHTGDALSHVTLHPLGGTASYASGSSPAHFSKLPTGYYKVRVEAPGPRVAERVVALRPGEREDVRVDVPPSTGSRLSNEVIDQAGLGHHAHPGCDYCETAGAAVESHGVPSLLALISDAASRGKAEAAHAQWLDRIGFDHAIDLPDTVPCGIQVLLATEQGNRPAALDFVRKVGLRVWHQGSEVSPTVHFRESSKISGLGGFVLPAEPGHCWFSVQFPDQPEAVFPVTIIDRFLTKWVIHQDSDGLVHLYESMISRDPDGPPTPRHLRRLQEVQRFLALGNLSRAARIARPLTEGESFDPVSGIIGAHLFLRPVRDLPSLDRVSRRMLTLYPTLSDSHVLRAAYYIAMRMNPDEVTALHREARRLGPPIYRHWFNMLAASDQRRNVVGPVARLIAEMGRCSVGNPVWTAWQPTVIEAGRRIEPS